MPKSQGSRLPSKQVRRQRERDAYATRYQRRRRWVGVVAILAAAGIGTITVLQYVGTGTDETVEADAAPGEAEDTTTTTHDFNVPCPEPDGTSPRRTRFRRPPPFCLDPAKDYRAEVETNAGAFTIELYEDKAPETVNNFVFLARYHFYDGLPFDKGSPDFYLQMGKPLEGTNPGYFINDELPQPGEYRVGSVIMANAGPHTNGSQFLILTGESRLADLTPPAFPLFGEVAGGWEVVQGLAALAQPDGMLSQPHVIQRITITEE